MKCGHHWGSFANHMDSKMSGRAVAKELGITSTHVSYTERVACHRVQLGMELVEDGWDVDLVCAILPLIPAAAMVNHKDALAFQHKLSQGWNPMTRRYEE
jgi:hypothetical protein